MDSRKMFSSLLKDGHDKNKCDSMGDRTPYFSSLKFVSEESHFNFLLFLCHKFIAYCAKFNSFCWAKKPALYAG